MYCHGRYNHKQNPLLCSLLLLSCKTSNHRFKRYWNIEHNTLKTYIYSIGLQRHLHVPALQCSDKNQQRSHPIPSTIPQLASKLFTVMICTYSSSLRWAYRPSCLCHKMLVPLWEESGDEACVTLNVILSLTNISRVVLVKLHELFWEETRYHQWTMCAGTNWLKFGSYSGDHLSNLEHITMVCRDLLNYDERVSWLFALSKE